jgi:diguanylate cyclase (GGDEF)-like protein
MLLFALVLSVSFYLLSRTLRLAIENQRNTSLAVTAVFARVYADLQYPGPWENRAAILYKGNTMMSGNNDVSSRLLSYIKAPVRIEYRAGIPNVNLQSGPPWYDRLLFMPEPEPAMKKMRSPPPDLPTVTSSGAFLVLSGEDGRIAGYIHVAQMETGIGGPRNGLYPFFFIAGALLVLIIAVVLSAIVYRLSKPIDVIEKAHRRAVLHNAELSRTACMDPLTGLLNRKGLLDALSMGFTMDTGDVYIAMFDIDHFKHVNDTWGHECGDLVLAGFAEVLRNGVRKQDYCARWGGEEFLALFVGVDAQTAERSADRLRVAIETHQFACKGQPVPVTVTIGLAVLASASEFAEAVDRADKALYHGKQSGRNRVVIL